MKIQIKIAETPEELDQLFRLRHTVYVEQDGYMDPQPDGRIQDRFELLPTTYNAIALADGRVIGGTRFAQVSPAGLSSDDYYEFRPHLPPAATVWGNGSMLCLSTEFRGSAVAQALLTIGYAGALRRQWSHMVTVVNPKVEVLFRRNGWKSLSPTLYNTAHHLPFVAMMIDLANFRASLRCAALKLAQSEPFHHEVEHFCGPQAQHHSSLG